MADEILAGDLIVTIKASVEDFVTKFRTAISSVGGLSDACGAVGGKVTKFAGTAIADMEGFVQQYGKDLKTIGISLGAFGAAVTAGMGLSIQAAADNETAMVHLKAQVEASGNSWGVSKDKVDGYLKSVMETTKYSDEQASGSLKTMLLYTKDLDQAFGATSLAMDVSTRTGRSLETVSRAIGMALNGNVELLGRYIPELKMSINEELRGMEPKERSAYAMQLMREQFGGAASVDLTTFNGLVQQLGNFINEVQEAIGEPLVEDLKSVISSITSFFISASTFLRNHPKFSEFFALVAVGLGAIATVAGTLMLALPYILTTVLPALEAVGLSMAVTGPWGLAIAAFIAALALIITYWDEIASAFKTAWDVILKPVLGIIKNYFSDLWYDDVTGIKVIWGYIWEKVSGVITDIGLIFEPFITFMSDAWNLVLWPLVRDVWTWIWNKISGVLGYIYNKFQWVMHQFGLDLPAMGVLWDAVGLAGEGAATGIGDKWKDLKTSYNGHMQDMTTKHDEKIRTETKAEENKKTDVIAFMSEETQAYKDSQDAQTNKLDAATGKRRAAYQGETGEYKQDTTEVTAWMAAEWLDYTNEVFDKEIGLMPTAFEECMTAVGLTATQGFDQMGKDLWNDINSGKVKEGLDYLKQGFINIFENILGEFETKLMTGIKTKVTELASSLGETMSGLLGSIASFGITAAAGVIVNLATEAFTPDYEKRRKERERTKALGTRYYTTEGIEAELTGSEWLFTRETMYRISDAVSMMKDLQLNWDKMSKQDRSAWFKILREQYGIEAFEGVSISDLIKKQQDYWNDMEEAAAAGYGYKALIELMKENPDYLQSIGGTINFQQLESLGRASELYRQEIPERPTFHMGGIIPENQNEQLIRVLSGESVLNRVATQILGAETINRLNAGASSLGNILVNISGNYINSELDMRILARNAGQEILNELKHMQVLPT